MKTSKAKIDFGQASNNRNENGFVDLNGVGLNINNESIEKIGSTLEQKNWIEFTDRKKIFNERKKDAR